jgi:hypothetical protein
MTGAARTSRSQARLDRVAARDAVEASSTTYHIE